MSTSLDRLNWRGKSAESVAATSLLRQPARIVAAAGAVMIIVGCLSPWAVGTDGNRTPVGFGANDGTADGVFLVVGAIFLLITTLNRGYAETRSRSLQLAPFAIAIASSIIWISGRMSADLAVKRWIATGGSGSLSWAIWLTLAGIAVAAAGSVWIYLRRPAEIRATTAGIGEEWQLTRWGVAEAAAGALGAALGASLGLIIAVAVAGSLGVLLMVILCAGGFMFGLQGAVVLVRWLERRSGG